MKHKVTVLYYYTTYINLLIIFIVTKRGQKWFKRNKKNLRYNRREHYKILMLLIFSNIPKNHFSSATVMHIGQSRFLLMCKLCKYFTVNVSFQIETKFTERPTSMLVFIKKQFSPFLDQRLSSRSKA